MALPTPPNINNPIPNNPFYYPDEYSLCGQYNNYVVGNGLSISPTGVISTTGGNVTGVIAGLGISVSSSVGNVTVSNIGVLSLTAGSGIALTGSTGNVTISATGGGGGGVSSVTATSPILSSGGANPNITALPATTSSPGVVQLTDSVSTVSSSLAASATAVKLAYDAAISAGTSYIPNACLVSKGALVTATAAGVPAAFPSGFDGQVLTADSTAICGLRWTNVGGTGTVTSVGTGTGLTGGPITGFGTIALVPATTLALGGVKPDGTTITVAPDGTITAVTGGTGTVTSVTAGTGLGGGTITTTGTISLNIATTAAIGGVKPDGTTITVLPDGTISAVTGGTGTVTSITAGTGLSGGTITTSGTIALNPATVAVLGGVKPDGTTITIAGDGTISAVAGGAGTVTSVATTGALTGGPITTSGTLDLAVTGVTANTYSYPTNLTVDACGRITSVASFSNPPVTHGDFQAKGDLLAGTGINAFTDLPVGTDGQVLTACNACNPTGLFWSTPAVTPDATPTVAGIIKGCTNNTAYNTLLGENAGVATTSGTYNTLVGFSAGPALTTGFINTVLGACSLLSATTARTNVAIGFCALPATTNGQSNVAIGNNALLYGTNVSQNIAIGSRALQSLTAGGINVGVGEESGTALTSGQGNILVGYQAGRNLTSGNNNVAIGPLVNLPSATGNSQLAIGTNAGEWLTGDSTFAIQPGAGIIDCTGSCGTVGQVLVSTGSNSICWGAPGGAPDATPTAAGVVKGCTNNAVGNVSLGADAMVGLTTGTCVLAIGQDALKSNTTGCLNLAIGYSAAPLATDYDCVFAIGHCSLANLPPASGAFAGFSNNTFIGHNSGLLTGSGGPITVPVVCTTIIGFNAGCSLGCSGTQVVQQSTALGVNALSGQDESRGNTAVGTDALGRGPSGNCNTAVGVSAGRFISGERNTAIGSYAMSGLNQWFNVAVGDSNMGNDGAIASCFNIAIGTEALYYADGTCCNIVIGSRAMTDNSGSGTCYTGSNNIVIGHCTQPSTFTTNNQVTIGNSSNNSYRIYGTWANISDARDKTAVTALPVGLDFVETLNPVKYTWQHRNPVPSKDGTDEIGFLAQELLEAQTQAGADYAKLVDQSNPDQLFINQTHLIPILVKAVQELAAEVRELKAKSNG